jgi:hypothetical protein
MPSTAILREAKKLRIVSENLSLLADQLPLLSDALITISVNVGSTAALLEVLVVTKLGPLPGPYLENI